MPIEGMYTGTVSPLLQKVPSMYLWLLRWHCYMGLNVRKPVQRFANKKGAGRLSALISTFVICLLESIVSRLVTSRSSILSLVSVAEQTGLTLTLSETLRQVLS